MTGDAAPRLTRRALLGLLAGAAVACDPRGTSSAPQSFGPSAQPPGTPAPIPTAEASASPSAAATERAAFEPIAGDVYPNAKRLAGRFVESLATYDPGDDRRAVLRRAARRADPSFDLDLALRQARPLWARGAQSRGAVVYPQLGGLTLGGGLDRAVVMVVLSQHLILESGEERTHTRTVDVRLINTGDKWRIEELANAGGQPVERPQDLPAAAQKVLDNPRIDLPDSARWDIHSGIIDERLLATMNDVAKVFPYSVAVLKSGHPYNVFGTDFVSGHTLGRGCDIWKIGDRPVVQQQPSRKSDAYAFTTALLEDLGVPELGSPWDLDGPPVPGELRPSFTDAVHADHIHVAFKAA